MKRRNLEGFAPIDGRNVGKTANQTDPSSAIVDDGPIATMQALKTSPGPIITPSTPSHRHIFRLTH